MWHTCNQTSHDSGDISKFRLNQIRESKQINTSEYSKTRVCLDNSSQENRSFESICNSHHIKTHRNNNVSTFFFYSFGSLHYIFSCLLVLCCKMSHKITFAFCFIWTMSTVKLWWLATLKFNMAPKSWLVTIILSTLYTLIGSRPIAVVPINQNRCLNIYSWAGDNGKTSASTNRNTSSLRII